LQSAGTHSILTHLGGLPALFRQSKKKARSGYFGPFQSLPSRTIPFQEKEPDPKKKDFIQNAGKVNLHKASPHVPISGQLSIPHTWVSTLLAVKQNPPRKWEVKTHNITNPGNITAILYSQLLEIQSPYIWTTVLPAA
jgi:hypothetical protein